MDKAVNIVVAAGLRVYLRFAYNLIETGQRLQRVGEEHEARVAAIATHQGIREEDVVRPLWTGVLYEVEA